MSFWQSIQHFYMNHLWVLQFLAAVLAGVAVNIVVNSVYRRLQAKLGRLSQVWIEPLITGFYKPFIWFIWIMVASVLVQALLPTFLGVNTRVSIDTFRRVAAVAFILWFVLRFLMGYERAELAKPRPKGAKLDKASLRSVFRLFRVMAIIIMVLITLQTFDISISTLLAFGGVGGIAFGFAAKDTLANFLGGLMIFVDRPFSIGDWIRSPDKNIEGTVEHIGWRLTMIRTFDKRPLYVPNGIFSNISVENASRMTNRRIKTLIGVRYDDATKVAKLVEEITAMLKSHPEIDTGQTTFVNLVDFAASSLNILIYCFTKTTEWVKFQGIQEDIFLKIIDIVTANGAQCAFPTTTLHVPDGVKVGMETLKGHPRLDQGSS